MKKVILTGFSLIAFAAASFAQSNTATLNQVGTSQNSTQNQSGNNLTSVVTQGNSAVADNTGNRAFTDQRSTNNTATVTQTTSQYNQGLIYQNTVEGKTAGGAQNEATIQQISSGTTALFPGDPNTTPVAGGSGTGSVARIGQEGEGNHASIQQNGTGAATGANNSNYGRIDQSGSNNGASVNDVYIHQNGTSQGNVGSISQQSGAATAKIEQNGPGNVASSGNTASINQSSAGVDAIIQQNAGSGAPDGSQGTSATNMATVNQTGGTGDASIQQNNGSGWAGANTAMVNQSAGDHTAIITQNDDSQRNKATINQDAATGGDQATINQTGFSGDGTATINQGGTSASGGGTNTAFIEMKNQTGTASDVIINQNVNGGEGKGNQATVYQGLDGNASAEVALGTSRDNHASVTQDGSNNVVNQYQVGVNNRSDITQTGVGNVVAGTSAFRSPGFAAQLGMSNTLTIDQMTSAGSGINTANVLQSGMGNTGTITQGNNP